MLAHTIARNPVIHELTGATLGVALSVYLHTDHFGTDVSNPDQDRFVSELKAEMVSIKQELTALKAKALCMCGKYVI